MSDVKRFDCTSGGAQFCQGCYTMTQDDEYGDYVLYEDYEALRARVADLEAAAKDAAPRGATHCTNCGCDWLDNGLNPIGCPYCLRRVGDTAYAKCLRDVVKQVVLMMDDCEEHADGRITIDCDTGADGFLRRIHDLLNALEIYTPDCVDEAFAAILSTDTNEVGK